MINDQKKSKYLSESFNYNNCQVSALVWNTYRKSSLMVWRTHISCISTVHKMPSSLSSGNVLKKRRQYIIKNKAAIVLQCESNVKLIAALLFIPYCRLIWGHCLPDDDEEMCGLLPFIIAEMTSTCPNTYSLFRFVLNNLIKHISILFPLKLQTEGHLPDRLSTLQYGHWQSILISISMSDWR